MLGKYTHNLSMMGLNHSVQKSIVIAGLLLLRFCRKEGGSSQ